MERDRRDEERMRWRMLTYADVCWRQVEQERAQKERAKAEEVERDRREEERMRLQVAYEEQVKRIPRHPFGSWHMLTYADV